MDYNHYDNYYNSTVTFVTIEQVDYNSTVTFLDATADDVLSQVTDKVLEKLIEDEDFVAGR